MIMLFSYANPEILCLPVPSSWHKNFVSIKTGCTETFNIFVWIDYNCVYFDIDIRTRQNHFTVQRIQIPIKSIRVNTFMLLFRILLFAYVELNDPAVVS